MVHENTNWGQSVTGVVIKEGKVLLTRHTYGDGRGMLIIPGGYVENGETPMDALKREFLEETRITVEPKRIIGIRFNSHDWYVAFAAEYVSGKAESDHDENSEAVWLDTADALAREDVPDLTKKLIRCVLSNVSGLEPLPYEGSSRYGKGYLYGTMDKDDCGIQSLI